jgi:biotin carboxyl carrier protein
VAKYYVTVDDREVGIEVLHTEAGTTVRALSSDAPSVNVEFAAVHSNVDTGEGLYSLIADGKSYQVHAERTEEGMRMVIGRHRIDLTVLTEREWRLHKVAPRQAQQSGTIIVKAPMPGLVKSVLVSAGDEVAQGQRLVVLEAMKMENDIVAARPGRVSAVHVDQGATVDGGKPLVTME